MVRGSSIVTENGRVTDEMMIDDVFVSWSSTESGTGKTDLDLCSFLSF